MVKQTTEKIKLHSYTKKLLDGLKTEENWTFDSVIKSLVYEHEELTDPDTIADKEKKLNDDYVEIAEYRRVYKENTDRHYKIKELEEKLEETLKGMKEEKEGSIAKFKEQHDIYEKQHDDYVEEQKLLTSRVWELRNSQEENKGLSQRVDHLNFFLSDMNTSLSDTQKDYEECSNRYSSFKARVSEDYITKKQLETLYHVSWFLSQPLNKRRVFSAYQLYKKMQSCSNEDIEEIIPLVNYKIFPIRKHMIKDEDRNIETVCFGFDRHYFKR